MQVAAIVESAGCLITFRVNRLAGLKESLSLLLGQSSKDGQQSGSEQAELSHSPGVQGKGYSFLFNPSGYCFPPVGTRSFPQLPTSSQQKIISDLQRGVTYAKGDTREDLAKLITTAQSLAGDGKLDTAQTREKDQNKLDVIMAELDDQFNGDQRRQTVKLEEALRNMAERSPPEVGGVANL